MIGEYIAVAIIAYLVGAIPSGVIIGRLTRGIDIRNHGSGSMGFTNAFRFLGLLPSLLILAADFVKGYLPVIVTWHIFHDYNLQIVAALASVVGHDWPVYVGFRGGRGVTTAYGAYMAMNLPMTAGLMVIGIIILAVFRYMSLMSVITVPLGALAFLLLAIAGYTPYAYSVCAVLLAGLIVFKHRGNIQRLLAGTEPKLGQSRPAHPH